jgi:hypothetical protein
MVDTQVTQYLTQLGSDDSSMASDTIAYKALVAAFFREVGINDFECNNQIDEM